MRRFIQLLLLTVSLMTVPHATADEDQTSEADWKLVDVAMENVTKSLKQSDDTLRAAIAAFDETAKGFRAKHPTDARRWSLRFFEGVTLDSRLRLGLPWKEDKLTMMNEILSAPDAAAETRSGASAVRSLASYLSLDSDAGRKTWITQTEEHLQKYSVHPANQRIRANLEHVKSQLAFRDKTPELKYRSIDGQEVDLAKLKGKVVLIDFWASYCDQCNADMPGIARTYEKLHPKGFEIIGICLDKGELEMRQFMEANDMRWPQYHDGREWDGALVGSLGVHYVPTMWLVDKKGRIVCTDARGRLEELVTRLLKE